MGRRPIPRKTPKGLDKSARERWLNAERQKRHRAQRRSERSVVGKLAKGAVKRERRAAREIALAEATRAASVALGSTLYSVLYADPPWRFEPWSRVTGMDRAADNHYPTMTTADLCALKVPAAENCVLFLWATAPMLPHALDVMAAWGFAYVTHLVWEKDRIGTGYWTRSVHELLLIGTRGDVPAPLPGAQVESIIPAPRGAHSEKPAQFARLIEQMFPNVPRLEMFARGPRKGWNVWGAEADSAPAAA